MYCYLKGTLDSGSARSVTWWGPWLLLGTDEGSLKTLRVPEDFPKPRKDKGDADPVSEGDENRLNTQTHEAHVVSLPPTQRNLVAPQN